MRKQLALASIVFLLVLLGCERKPTPTKGALTYQLPSAFLARNRMSNNNPTITCEQYPAFTERLEFPSRYEGSGPARDELNPLSSARYQSMTNQINQFTRRVTQLSDQLYRLEIGSSGAACLLQQMHHWATENALLNVGNATGVAVRKWNLAALASNYLKVRPILLLNSTEDDAMKIQAIEQWLLALAWQVHSDYSQRPPEKLNNHDYWAAWSVLLVATLHREEDLFLWSESIFNRAISLITVDGFLPSELKRASRAAHYHNFALAPLIATASFLDANKRLTPEHRRKLLMLVNNVLSTVHNTVVFEQKTGVEQSPPEITTRGRLAWLAIWVALTNDSDAIKIAGEYSLTGTSRLGGDTFAMYPISSDR